MTENKLDDPDYARFAWGRYKKLMLWMVLASSVATAVGIGLLLAIAGPMPLIAMIFVAGGIFFSVLLAAALMGLVFLSSGTGHDGHIEDPSRDDRWSKP